MAHYNKKLFSCLITTACNLRCKYCITTSMDQEDQHIDTEFVREAMKDYFEKTRNYKVRYYSVGEPTQNFEGMKEIHRIAEDLAHGGVYYELLTNGYFNDEVLEWVGKNINRVWVSYDGPSDVCDTIRVTPNDEPATEKITDTIHRLKGMTSVGIGLTISKPNLYRQTEVIEEIADMGIDCVISKAVLNPVGTQVDDVYAVDIMEYAREFVKAWRRGREIGVHYTNDMVFNFDGHSNYYCRCNDPTPHLTPDGYVSSCDRAFMGDTPLQDLIYGKWDPENKKVVYWPDRIEKIQNRGVHNMEDCKDCSIRYQCCGHCLGTTYQFTGDLYRANEYYCPAIKYLYAEMKKDMKPGEFWPVEYTN
ncbi:MAG: radical SAM protein [Halobacteriota archaeon]|nr:radical SAM protein [Halobacteriota archaeon]